MLVDHWMCFVFIILLGQVFLKGEHKEHIPPMQILNTNINICIYTTTNIYTYVEQDMDNTWIVYGDNIQLVFCPQGTRN
jgi:hypothetical protein